MFTCFVMCPLKLADAKALTDWILRVCSSLVVTAIVSKWIQLEKFERWNKCNNETSIVSIRQWNMYSENTKSFRHWLYEIPLTSMAIELLMI